MRIKFRIFFFLLSLLTLSCRRRVDDAVTLKFWAMGAEGESVQKLVPLFEQQFPDIKIKVQMIPWTAAQEKLITAYASDNLPDIFQLGNTWIPQFAALGAIEKLNTYVKTSPSISAKNYFPGIWQTNLIDSILYGIPWYIDTRVLFYRKDILSKAGYDHPPQTWDELYRISKAIKQQAGREERYAIYLPTNEWATFVIFAFQAGATLLKDNNCYGNFSSPEFKKAFSFLIRFYRDSLTPLGISEVTNVYQAFSQGYFAMYISGPWNVKDFNRWMKGPLHSAWATAPLPGPDRQTPGLSLAGGSSLVINRLSTRKKKAWKFVEFLSRPDIQSRFYKLVSDLPAVKQSWQDSSLQNNTYIRAFYEQFQHIQATPKIPEWEQIAFSKIQQYVEIAARGQLSIDETLKRLDEDVNHILEKRRWLLRKQNDK